MPPQNAGYMYAAYAAAGLIYVGYVLSIWWRARAITRRREREIGSVTSRPAAS